MCVKYTLIIPHYNIPSYLNRLLDSVPKRDDLQVIVVDDCSNKNLEILDKVKNEYNWIEWYDTGINGGGGKARNIGLKNAKGKYVLFADADDYFTEKFDDFLSMDFTSDIVFFNCQGIYSDSKRLSIRADHVNEYIRLYQKNREKGELYLKYLFGEPWGKLIKTEIIDSNNIKFDEIRIHNDTYFSYMVGWYTKTLEVYPEIVYMVTDREQSVSKNINWNNLEIRTKVFAKKTRFLYDHDIDIFDFHLWGPLDAYILNLRLHKIVRYFKELNKENIPPTLIMRQLCKRIIKKIYKDEI